MNNIDLELLDRQRLALAQLLIDDEIPDNGTNELWGIVNLLDGISDQLHELDDAEHNAKWYPGLEDNNA